MHELYELKEMLCDELKEYGGKGELTAGTLDVVDKLSHAIKNLNKILEADDEEYSNRYMYDDGRSYEGSYERRGMRGYSRRRDRMGRYSRDGMADKLRELMQDAPNEKAKDELRKLADRIESM